MTGCNGSIVCIFLFFQWAGWGRGDKALKLKNAAAFIHVSIPEP
jgi:hypothetical protein